MFGISGGELIVLLVIAALILGPKNVAQALHGLRKLLEWAREWSARLRTDTSMDLSVLGIDPGDVEKIKNFNLSQYDPRQMVREAVQEEMNAWIAATSGAAKAGRETAAGAVSAMQQAAAPFPVDAATPAQGIVSTPPGGNAAGDAGQRRSGLYTPTDGPAASATSASATDAAARQSSVPNYLAPAVPSDGGQPDPAAETASTSSSHLEGEDDGPLDLHTILNRPDIGGSR
ncbi:hypothetical protein VR010_11245 [Actinomycetaceae bacterium L2_0104]